MTVFNETLLKLASMVPASELPEIGVAYAGVVEALSDYETVQATLDHFEATTHEDQRLTNMERQTLRAERQRLAFKMATYALMLFHAHEENDR